MKGRKPAAKPATVVQGPWTGDDNPDLPMPVWLMAPVKVWGEARAKIAGQRWAVLIDSMSSRGTLAPENAPLVEMAALAYADWRLAEAHVAKFGPIVPAPRTGVPMHNPYRAVADGASKKMQSFERDLGIPPIERGRAAPAPKRAKKLSPADAYLPPKA